MGGIYDYPGQILNEVYQVFNHNSSKTHEKPDQCTQDQDKLSLSYVLDPEKE